MSSVSMYRVYNERLLRSEVTWWDAPLSRSHDDVVEGLVARWACGCHGEPAGVMFEMAGDWTGTSQNEGHRLAVCPWILQIWQWPRYSLGRGRGPCDEWELDLVAARGRWVEEKSGRHWLFILCVGLAVAGKYGCMGMIGWREASKLRSFSCSSSKVIGLLQAWIARTNSL